MCECVYVNCDIIMIDVFNSFYYSKCNELYIWYVFYYFLVDCFFKYSIRFIGLFVG